MAFPLGLVPRIVAVLGLLLTLTSPCSAFAQPLEWTQHGAIAEGSQFDAARGPDGRVHLISSRYYALASDGTVLGDEDPGTVTRVIWTSRPPSPWAPTARSTW